jgi:hypothetical protein
MGPRFIDRGNRGRPWERRCPHLQLQRGRGSLTAEIWDRGCPHPPRERRRPRRRFAAALQWGRGSLTAEIRERRRPRRRFAACFNGAAVH